MPGAADAPADAGGLLSGPWTGVHYFVVVVVLVHVFAVVRRPSVNHKSS
jgi:hypothetical protein